MRFVTIDPETEEMQRVTEPRTIKIASRCLGVAISRWLMSGLDVPDREATDGVSEFEGAMLE